LYTVLNDTVAANNELAVNKKAKSNENFRLPFNFENDLNVNFNCVENTFIDSLFRFGFL
jgi:hypothetical protein